MLDLNNTQGELMNKYVWLEKKYSRNVDRLRLWTQNPRLDPEVRHTTLSDYASDLFSESGEKDSFIKLVKSIARDGFVPADPIVVWKDSNNRQHYVAEGNRRVLALKLLRSPDKAPQSLRGLFRKNAALINLEDIEKISVCIAPSLTECEWYINQRHSSSSIQRSWSRHQQQRWIAEIYYKHGKSAERVMAITHLSKSDLKSTLRILALRDLAFDEAVFSKLNDEDKGKIKSHRLPMTILERWFENLIVREKWGIEFTEDSYTITSNRNSFLAAYTEWIKLVLHRDDDDVTIQINTRTITSDLINILDTLPNVLFDGMEDISQPQDAENEESSAESSSTEETDTKPSPKPQKPQVLYRDPSRKQIVVSSTVLKTSNYKLLALFKEFKKIPTRSYRHCVAASLRVFLDLTVREYIDQEGCANEIARKYQCSIRDVILRKRLEYLKSNRLTAKTPAYKSIEKLLFAPNSYSLDTLNSYVHGKDTHNTSVEFLNGFWDSMFPLFEVLVDIKEP